jgi:hypothetical protein
VATDDTGWRRRLGWIRAGTGARKRAWWWRPSASARAVIRRFPWAPADLDAAAAAETFDRDWVDAAWAWRDETSPFYPRIARPDAMDCLRAQVGWLLGRRGGDGELLETPAWRVAALLRAGQTEAARTWIERAAAGMRSNGWVPDRLASAGVAAADEFAGRHAQQGQFVFMALEYYRFTQDTRVALPAAAYPQLVEPCACCSTCAKREQSKTMATGGGRRRARGRLVAATPARKADARCIATRTSIGRCWGWKEGRAAASLLGLLTTTPRGPTRNLPRAQVGRARSLRARMDLMEDSWIPAAAEE